MKAPGKSLKAKAVFDDESHWFSFLFDDLYEEDAGIANESERDRSWWSAKLDFLKRYYNFWPGHAAYFLIMSFIGAGLLSNFQPGAAFLDVLFMSVSAITVSSLTTIPLSQMPLQSQFVIWFWMLFGGQLIVSCAPMVVRMVFFRRAVHRFVKQHGMVFYEVQPDGTEVQIDPAPEHILHSKYALEYQAQRRFFKVVLVYIFAFLVGAALILGVYLRFYDPKRALLDANNVNPFWWAAFTVVSGFNSAGFGLFDDSFVQFVDDHLVTLVMSLVVVFGQTGAPIFLRVFVWSICRYRRWRGQQADPVWEFMLNHPRKSFTHMFDAHQTRVLAVLVFGTLFVQAVSFLALEWNWSTAGWSFGERLNAAWFQSAATRFSGFNCVDMTKTNPANWVLWASMMYLASYPLHVAIRSSNLNAEPSFWIDSPPDFRSRWLKIAQRILRRELIWLFLAVYAIVAIEADRVRDDPHFTIFHIIFEVSSAFGTCGLSLGYPGSPVSFSGQLRPGSKLVIMATMFFGRHRGLPDAIDSAVSLPRELEFDVPDSRTVRVRPAGSASSPRRHTSSSDVDEAAKCEQLAIAMPDGDEIESAAASKAGYSGPARQAAGGTRSDDEASTGDVRSRSNSDTEANTASIGFDADPEDFVGYRPSRHRGTYASPPTPQERGRPPTPQERGRPPTPQERGRPRTPGSPRTPHSGRRTRGDAHLALGTHRHGESPSIEMGELSLHRYPD